MVALHWLTVLCLLGAATAILVRDEVATRAARQWLLEIHRHFGLVVLALFFIRAAVRIRIGKLPPVGKTTVATRVAAGTVHFALYVVLLVQPLLGWVLSSAEGKPVHLFGLTLPSLVTADEDLADTLQQWHLGVACLLLGLVAMHVSAALWHHFVLRDGLLRAMWLQRQRNE
ncbi:cytochrome b [Dyella choica]|uniref:Cytochrome b n=1 Tax=Dyella choica TaxID=1927959 RepID=A0A432M146_9GAMM|nr:cytochrome b [Dyella choica]